MERQLEYVLRTVEERGVRFVRLWFTDVLGLPEVGRDHPGRAGGRPRGGHDLRRLHDRGLQPDPGIRHAGQARPEHLRTVTGRRRSTRPSPACSATSSCSPASRSTATPATCSSATSSGRGRRASRSSSGPRWSSSTSGTGRRRSSRSTTPATSTSPPTTSAPSSASRRCCASRRWASRWSTRSTRTARASTRSTCATPTRSRWPTT